jgi:hypothetical protein
MNVPHPNATVGSVSAAGGGALIVWVLSLLGVDVDPYIATVIAGGVAGLLLLVGRKGVKGVARVLWSGSGK